MGALQRTGHLQVSSYDSQCSSSFYVYVLYVCSWRHAVPLKVLSSSGPSPGEGQRKVWKVRVRLGPAPKSIPKDLNLSYTLFLVFTITLYHQLLKLSVCAAPKNFLVLVHYYFPFYHLNSNLEIQKG